MSEHRGHLRLDIEGESFHRAPEQLPAEGRPIAVREVARSADDGTAGIHRYETTVDGWVFSVAVEDEPRALLRERAGEGASGGRRHGSDEIRAQIPGRVVRLWVTEGDTVEAGQRLLAIEAMKMENEVRAPRSGTVEEVHVAAGDSVELGDELLCMG